jgi:hypothetical protein
VPRMKPTMRFGQSSAGMGSPLADILARANHEIGAGIRPSPPAACSARREQRCPILLAPLWPARKTATFSAKISAGIRLRDRTLPTIGRTRRPPAAGQSGHGSMVLPLYGRQDQPSPRP